MAKAAREMADRAGANTDQLLRMLVKDASAEPEGAPTPRNPSISPQSSSKKEKEVTHAEDDGI